MPQDSAGPVIGSIGHADRLLVGPHHFRGTEMLVVSGTITFNPDSLDAGLAAIATLVTATRAEDGCVSYGFYQTPEAPHVFRVFEEWASAEAMAAHMGSEHLLGFLGSAGEIGITGAELDQYEISDKTKLM